MNHLSTNTLNLTIMALRVKLYNRFCVFSCFLLLCILAACSQQEDTPVNSDLVSLKIMASASTKAADGSGIEDLPKVEKAIYDLSVCIFDSKGNAISFAGEQFNDGVSDEVKVYSRTAKGCTVYVVANALKLGDGSTSPFAGATTLQAFKNKVHTLTGQAQQANPECLLMVGKKDNVDINQNTGKILVTLTRLASKLTFDVTLEDGVINGKTYPITVESYQVCRVPDRAFYHQENFATPAMPSGVQFQDLPTSAGSAEKSQTYTCYVYANSNATGDDVTYLKIIAHSIASAADTDRKLWTDEFKVELPNGKKVLPNYRYKVNILIKGWQNATNGIITSYKAYPYFSSLQNLKQWEKEENPDVMKGYVY